MRVWEDSSTGRIECDGGRADHAAADVNGAEGDDHAAGHRALVFGEPVNEFEYRLNATPLGNGRIGCMFTGGPARDLILLNHEALRPVLYRESEHLATDRLDEVRRLCADGAWERANEVFTQMVAETGALRRLNGYHPVADLIVEMRLPGPAYDYRRVLNMTRGLGEVAFRTGGVGGVGGSPVGGIGAGGGRGGGPSFVRRYFVSADAGRAVLQIGSTEPGAVDMDVALGRMPVEGCRLQARSRPGRLDLRGTYTDGTVFDVVVEVAFSGPGTVRGDGAYEGPGESRENYGLPLVRAGVSGADEVAISVSINVHPGGGADAAGDFCASVGRPWTVTAAEEMLRAHTGEHSRLFGRTSLTLGDRDGGPGVGGCTGASSDARTLIHKAYLGHAPARLFETVFDMGRYLLMSSSRACRLPANLQGLWNHSYDPPWQCRYQLDVNLQAAYWAANPTNLPECNEPLFRFLEDLAPAAERFAHDLYGCRGIVLGVGTDGVNVRYPSNVETQCIAGWLARHFWDHYLFTLDTEFLRRRAYPYMKAVGAFWEDFLVEDTDGLLAVVPSNSPENTPANRTVRLSKNATIDCAVAREVLSTLIEASRILGIDETHRAMWVDLLARLPDWPIRDGILAEWADESAEENHAHRHVSHLYPLFPGSAVTTVPAEQGARLKDAAVEALRRREAANRGDACSFTYVWAALLFARAGCGNEAYERLRLFCRGFLMDNLLTSMGDRRQLGMGRGRSAGLASHIFQIEAGLAATAAIAEMLLQSTPARIMVLPALPDAWPAGSVRGLRARGGYTVNISWRNLRPVSVSVNARGSGTCRLVTHVWPDSTGVRCRGESVPFSRETPGELAFQVEAGRTYEVSTAANGAPPRPIP